jgi:membrane protein DedA with SNARE-associated domain
MTMESIIISGGYPAVLIGTFFEGETVLVLAGFFAHRGYMNLAAVMALAFMGGFLGDFSFFMVGRRYGSRIIEKRPRLRSKMARFDALFSRFGGPLVIALRFLYGLRIVGPVIIGAHGMKPYRFMLYNALGALIWSVSVSSAGYFFGRALDLFLRDVKRYELYVVGSAIALAAVIYCARRAIKTMRRGA